MSTRTVAANAIARSASHNEIVTIDLSRGYDSAVLSDLLVACDDWVDADEDTTEYWGTTDRGEEWRVHVRHGIASARAEYDV